jgi:UDP-N-acetylmuramoyl-L-alanyl-D-glutamate--2,6-diaminopimelate ligase
VTELLHSFSFRELASLIGRDSSVESDVRISGLNYDSRHVQRGDLFFAVSGAHVDGHAYVAQAVERGASAVVSERPVNTSVPSIVAPSILEAMSKISAAFYDHPSKRIPVIGITGTNGKTTTTFLIENIFRKAERLCGVLGTVNYRIGADQWPAPNTTPMSVDVQRFIDLAAQKKAAAVVMEVSSHALALHRVDDVVFSAGVFTNLTQDHLDFHKTMEEYFRAKSLLFKRAEHVHAAINIDDEYGVRLAKELKNPITYAIDAEAKLRALDVASDLRGIRFVMRMPSGSTFPIINNLLGRHNIYNCLSAAGAMLAYGLPEKAIAEGLNQNHSVPGRLERVEAGQRFVVAVDYAHTHDALAQVLTTLRATGPRRLICVFGAGGDRDKTKRPKMGRVAVEIADQVVVTSDNPRSEQPAAIMKDIEQGILAAGKKNYVMIESREEAIQSAVASAKDGDIILIAGKGHETYQIFADRTIHFSDFDVARRALKK